MKNILTIGSLLLACAVSAQTTNPPVFLSTSADSAGAIGLRWQSQSNLVYRIDYASVLVNSNTQWQTLYEDYPSQGTNTIWKDAGTELTVPSILHPNDTDKRFYRVVVTGTNNSSQPQVGIASPAANSVLSDYVTVSISVTSSLSAGSIRLFVDGQEAGNQLYPGTNFLINTAQFGNGPHNLFAVAENLDGAETTLETANLVDNFTASPYRSVTFDNYISDFRASARFVEPADGETMKFNANFAAYSNWTLVISNSSAVTVRTVTGSGYNMTFVWDGTDNSSNSISADFYSPTLSAVLSTNGPPPGPDPEPDPLPSPSSSQRANSASGETDTTIFYPRTSTEALAVGSDVYYMLPPPMPPIKKDGTWRGWEDIFGPQPFIPVPVPARSATSARISGNSFDLGGGFPDAPAAAGGATTTLIPPRVVHSMGKMGFAFQGHHPGVGFGSNNRPSNGLGGRVTLNGNSGITGAFGPLKSGQGIFNGFFNNMQSVGYRLKYQAKNDNLVASDLRGSPYGGTNKFNKVNIGLLVGHGVYGTTPDFTISGSGPLETYYPIYKTGVNSYDWVGFTQFKFGSGSSSVLRWMGILSCNNMIGSCYDDMYDKEVLPIGNSLHLLLGCSSTVYLVSNFGWEYSSALTGLSGVTRRTVAESWFYAGSRTQGFQTKTNKISVFFRVAGWPACFSDDLINYSSPDSGNPADIMADDREVFHP